MHRFAIVFVAVVGLALGCGKKDKSKDTPAAAAPTAAAAASGSAAPTPAAPPVAKKIAPIPAGAKGFMGGGGEGDEDTAGGDVGNTGDVGDGDGDKAADRPAVDQPANDQPSDDDQFRGGANDGTTPSNERGSGTTTPTRHDKTGDVGAGCAGDEWCNDGLHCVDKRCMAPQVVESSGGGV